MKKGVVFTLVFFSIAACLVASAPLTQPEKIEPITKVAHSRHYYHEQALLWKKETAKDATRAEAWFNYFQAARYANSFVSGDAALFDLDEILENMNKAIPNSFEYYCSRYIISPWGRERFDNLLKANALSPDHPELLHDLFTYYICEGNQVMAGEYARKLFYKGAFQPALLAWNYNALASVEENAILLTHGDNDTYPAWVLQAVKGVRPKISVVNVNLLLYEDYRERLFKELEMPVLPNGSFTNYGDDYQGLIRQFLTYAKRPVYLATSVAEAVRERYSDSLYLTGLAFKYAAKPFDNVAVLKNNYEQFFLKDHLRIDLQSDTNSTVMGFMNLHYLPALILLHHHYTANGEQLKAGALEEIMRNVARAGHREDQVNNYLQQAQAPTPTESLFTIKALEKGLKKIKGNLYACETEVTNAQYENFLMDLVKNKAFDYLETCKTSKTDWRSRLPELHRGLSDSIVFRHCHPDEGRAPVQNISQEAARLYCEWITNVYNQSNHKRKDFRRVRFRLPSEAEWEYAATVGHPVNPYPWEGDRVTNTKGCFLGNFEVSAEKPCDECPKGACFDNDGGFFPVMAGTYFPNDFGLYNISGNVAEMVGEPGIAKGGSWEDKPEQCKTSSRKTFDRPSPSIGFRVFMEVIE
jgi:formylglycine-generating enzyme required for sulfatase activity